MVTKDEAMSIIKSFVVMAKHSLTPLSKSSGQTMLWSKVVAMRHLISLLRQESYIKPAVYKSHSRMAL